MDYPDFSDKEMPYSLEAERLFSGAILIDQSVISKVLEKIKPECFYNEQHRLLFNIMLRMFTSGIKADIITVLNEAVREGILKRLRREEIILRLWSIWFRPLIISTATAGFARKNIILEVLLW